MVSRCCCLCLAGPCCAWCAGESERERGSRRRGKGVLYVRHRGQCSRGIVLRPAQIAVVVQAGSIWQEEEAQEGEAEQAQEVQALALPCRSFALLLLLYNLASASGSPQPLTPPEDPLCIRRISARILGVCQRLAQPARLSGVGANALSKALSTKVCHAPSHSIPHLDTWRQLRSRILDSTICGVTETASQQHREPRSQGLGFLQPNHRP